jgi:alginate production protein
MKAVFSNRPLRILIPIAACLCLSAATSADAKDEERDPRVAAKQIAVGGPLSQQEQILIRRPDRNRPDHPVTFPVFGRPLVFGGRLTAFTRYDRDKLLDFDFDDLDDSDDDGDGDITEPQDAANGQTPKDDELRVEIGLELDAFYPFTDNIAAYVEMGAAYRNLAWAKNAHTKDDWIWARGETWLYFGQILDSPLAVQAGRQRFYDNREWWWDQNLDAARLRLDLPRFHAQVAVAQELLPVQLDDSSIDPEDKNILQILANVQWEWAKKNRIGIYALHRNDHSSGQFVRDPANPCVPEDEIPIFLPPEAREFFRTGCSSYEDESDEDLTWFGVSASGRWKLGDAGRFYYWLEAAGVTGKETFTDYGGETGSRFVTSRARHKVNGYGVDVGVIWETRLPGKPFFTLGFAHGSGRSGDTEERDRGFRQTGMQDNKDKSRGVVSFRYYGELFDPELANLNIATAGVGMRFLEKSSVDFLYHHYRQDEATPFARDIFFKRDPDGRHRHIGDEIDLIIGIEDWEPIEFKIVGSIFRAGEAFQPLDGELSYQAALRIRLNY